MESTERSWQIAVRAFGRTPRLHFGIQEFAHVVVPHRLHKSHWLRLFRYLNQIEDLREPRELDGESEGRRMIAVQAEWSWGDEEWDFRMGGKPDVNMLNTLEKSNCRYTGRIDSK